MKINPRKLHLGLLFVWIILIIPTVLWWYESILWVLIISIYANIAAHWAGYQAAHVEKKMEDHENEIQRN